ncbi:MAG: pyridoxal phosphate-dependent aminotransferase [Actinobacteria bacterium]|nr:pyridoxal phosphate-dependent aminotransferase [Actinomycetota bacterium]MCG2802548.1 pyridoxal phosphate-dependent aminotransferase [Cellulomonas sp.]
MVLARRAAADERPHRIARLRADRLAAGLPLLDLSDSNPTRHGLGTPEALTAVAAATAGASVYDPDPRGPRTAREALAATRGGGPDDYWLTASTSEAYSWLLTLLADPGDRVAVPAPGYPLVEPLARFAGVGTVAYPVHYLHPHGWWIDLERLIALVQDPAVRAVVVVNPGNPTGAYLQPAEREQVVQACARTGTALIVDEVFGPYALDGRPPPAGVPGCLTFSLDGLSKLLCAPQLKLGWLRMSGPVDQVAEVGRALDQVADAFLSVAAPVAHALPELLELAPGSVARTRGRLATNLAAARRVLDGPYRVRRCDGGWTVVVDVPRYLEDDDLAAALLDAGLWAHPGWFYDLASPGSLALSLLPEPVAFESGCARLRATIEALA